MEKRKFIISSNEKVARDTFKLVLEAEKEDFVFSGEFVEIALEGLYLRRPISVMDTIPGGIVLLYKTVGKGTAQLSSMLPGSSLELLTGLGKGFDASACMQSALLIGGGLGSAPLFPVCRKLKEEGKKITTVLGFNTADDIVLEKEFSSMCDCFAIATMDGTAGVKGLVTDAIDILKPEFDYFYTCGPAVMMKAVCRKLPGGGEVSLEERMGCGSGFCYGCSCKTLTGTKRICMDGPVFKREEIIW